MKYFLASTEKWDQNTSQAFTEVTNEFTAEIKRTFWRPRASKEAVEQMEEPWRKPYLMPKFHAWTAHVKETAEYYGYYGVFSEEGFEHMQRESKRLRNQHSNNKNLGIQIVDDLQYSAVSTSPKSIYLRRNAELRCMENGSVLKKPRFSI